MIERKHKNLRYTSNEETRWVTLRDDIMFKRIFSENPEFLKLLLKCTFKFTEEELEGLDVTNGEGILPDKVGMKNFITDVTATLKNGDKIIVEMQVFNTESDTIKNELYADREISKQIKNIADKKKYDYKKIKKVYQLVIIAVNDVVDKNTNKLLESYTKKGNIDPLHKIMENYRKTVWLDLKGEVDYDKDENELIGFVTLFRAYTLEESLESIKYCPLMEEIIEKMKDYMKEDVMTTHEESQARYFECLRELEMKEAREEGLERGLEQGLERGLQQGLERGLEQGRIETNYEIAKNMLLNTNLTLEEISLCTTLSKSKLKEVESSLRTKLVS